MIVRVGVLDLLRYHLFTVGHFWIPEYGNPNDPDDLAVLKGISPYHNIQKDVDYPSTLILTGDHDDRVVPMHSYKYTAALQQAQAGDSPILLRIEPQTGHGAGMPVAKEIEVTAAILAFIKRELEL